MVQVSNGVPSAHITVNRNRLKTYSTNQVYLNDGDHFEIELWNPQTTPVLAEISIDGKKISSSGIIVRPGERVYLERWIDDPRKFRFSTYEVENTDETRKATANNGRVEVSFHDETVKNYTNWPNTLIWGNSGTGQPYVYPSFTTNVASGTTTLGGGDITFTSSVNCCYSASMDNLTLDSSPSMETGRSEKGEKSSQELVNGQGDFNWWATRTVSFQILPESRRPVEASKIRNYCTSCRTRVRSSSWKYCPSCGEEI